MAERVYTRREAQKMKPDIIRRYRDLVATNDLAGYEKLLDEYHVEGEEQAELINDFTRDAELVLRRHWRHPKWR
jgi:hypothetical protein